MVHGDVEWKRGYGRRVEGIGRRWVHILQGTEWEASIVCNMSCGCSALLIASMIANR